MVRLQPQSEYKASIKCLKTNETKELTTSGARLDYYIRHTDFLVTVTSDSQPKKYAPINRKAGTEYMEAKAKAEITVTASNVCKGCGAEKDVDSTGHCDRC